VSEYRESLDWFALGYRDAYNHGWWWDGADELDDGDFNAYADGYNRGILEWEADNR